MAHAPLTRLAPLPLRLLVVAVLLVSLLLVAAVGAGPAAAQPAPSEVADDIAATGSYLAGEVDADVAAAIDEANRSGIGVAVLDEGVPGSEIEGYSRDVLDAVQDRDGSYPVVLVSTPTSVGAYSDTVSDLGAALRSDGPAFRAFNLGDVAGGIEAFTAEVTGTAGEPAPGSPAADDGSGGFPWVALVVVIALVAVGAGAWWLVRERRGRQRARAELEAERAELAEQVRNNADKVIALGDPVLASGDADLVDLYAQASETYRDVSHRIKSATTRDAVRQLDRRMDDAEWRLEVIEARLAGRTPPPPPEHAAGGDGSRPAGGGPPPPAGPPPPGAGGRPPAAGQPAADPVSDLGDDRPALGRDETLFGTTLPPAPPPRLGWGGRGSRRRGRHGRR